MFKLLTSCLKEMTTVIVIRFHVFASLNIQIAIFWVVTPWRFVSGSQPFGGKFFLHYYCRSEWQESVVKLLIQTGRQRWYSLRTTGKSDRGLPGPREVAAWNGEEQSLRVRTKTNLRPCHVVDGLSETWKPEWRQTEACLFRLREKAVSQFRFRVFIAPIAKDKAPFSFPSPWFRMNTIRLILRIYSDHSLTLPIRPWRW
jgi:hypothetical protein